MHERVALITGGTGGAGPAVVAAFAAQGVTIIAPYRDAAGWAQLQSTLGEHAPRVTGRQTDLTDEAAVGALIADTLDQHGHIDYLLNLAGGFAGGSFIDTRPDVWHAMLALNLQPTLLCTHAVLPHMLARDEGRIVTIGSRPALEPAPNVSAYAAAKAAVVAMTRAIAREIRTTGVTIACVAPSTIDTPANRATMPKADPTKWVTLAQLADLLLYLCSPAASALNGAVIPLYGRL